MFVGWPISGIALEIFGILNLFGNMFPMFWAIVKNFPIVSSFTNNNTGTGSKRPSYYETDRDRGYGDDRYGDDGRDYYRDYRRDDEAEPYY